MELFKRVYDKLTRLESLAFAEAEDMMSEIMSGKINDIRLSAMLTALRIKGESPDEIAGCASAMRKFSVKLDIEDGNAVDIVGTGGDCSNTINVSTAAAITASAAGVTVAKHGNRSVSSLSGSADVLNAMGVNINISTDNVGRCINTIGLGFLFAPAFHPAMKHAANVRNELKSRTIFNVLGPLTNPAGVKRAVIGVYSKKLCRIMAEAARLYGYNHAMIVHGNDGLDEITTTATTCMLLLKDGIISEIEFDPQEYGINRASLQDLKGGSADINAGIIRKIFSGEVKSGPVKDIIVLNSAAALVVSEMASNWREALSIAEKAIDSGGAAKKLSELVKFTNQSLQQ